MSEENVRHAISRLAPADVDRALIQRILPIGGSSDRPIFAAGGMDALERAREAGLAVQALIDPDILLRALQQGLERRLKRSSVYGLAERAPEFSAMRQLTGRQFAWTLGIVLLAMDFYILSAGLTALLASLAFSALFLAVILIRFQSLLPLPRLRQPPLLADADLPVYTVLVPLFRETRVVAGLLEALDALDYPPDRLDIKIILEADDKPMRALIGGLTLPAQYEVIIVPVCRPRTKPKALNYALRFARGSLVTVFDAEDIPHPGQLRLAASRFAEAPWDLVCLQAALGFYNRAENWLTRQFALEYAMQFTMVFPLLAAYRMPLPLGGTSNHFRIAALRAVGGWDPHNVTEDADLGLRLSRFGLRAAMLPTYTAEEASCDFSNWLRQRARWLKGWLQTWLVHMRDPLRLWTEAGTLGSLVIQAMTAGIILSALFHPLFVLWMTASVLPHLLTSTSLSVFEIGAAASYLSVFVLGYGVAFCCAIKAGYRIDGKLWLGSALTMPAYWILVSMAAWVALWEFIVSPFSWNKTRHGVTRHPSARRR